MSVLSFLQESELRRYSVIGYDLKELYKALISQSRSIIRVSFCMIVLWCALDIPASPAAQITEVHVSSLTLSVCTRIAVVILCATTLGAIYCIESQVLFGFS